MTDVCFWCLRDAHTILTIPKCDPPKVFCCQDCRDHVLAVFRQRKVDLRHPDRLLAIQFALRNYPMRPLLAHLVDLDQHARQLRQLKVLYDGLRMVPPQ